MGMIFQSGENGFIISEALAAMNCSLYKRVLDYDQFVKTCVWADVNDKYPAMMESLAALQVEAKKLPKVSEIL